MSDKKNASATDRDIQEAEILSESIDEKIERGRNYSSSKENKPSALDELDEMEARKVIDQKGEAGQDKGNSKKESKVKSANRFSLFFAKLKQKMLSGAFFILVIGALVYLFAQQQWMQNRFENIGQDLQTLDKKIQVAKNHAETAQLGVQAIKTDDYSQQLEQQQATLQTLQQQLKSMQDKPSGVTAEQLEALEQKLSQQMQQKTVNAPLVESDGGSQMDSQTVEGLQDKFAQQIQQLQESQQQLALQIEQGAQDEATSPAKLSLSELKQWAVKMNGQWLLQAPIEQTQQQLFAFKQAVTLLPPQLSYSVELLVDQDIQQLQQRQAELAQKKIPDLASLRAIVHNMPQPKAEYVGEKSQNTPGEDGVWQGILSKLTELIKVQKRETETVTHVEALMLHEVIQQRLLMEIDRLDYALQVFSKPLIQRSIDNLNQLSKAQAPGIAEEMKTKLLPFAQLQYIQRKPLLITQIADVQS